jgi:hypothetical protein
VLAVQAEDKPIDLSEARVALMNYSAAAKSVQELAPIHFQAAADYERAVNELRIASAAVVRFCRGLGIHPRGGPGTLSL